MLCLSVVLLHIINGTLYLDVLIIIIRSPGNKYRKFHRVRVPFIILISYMTSSQDDYFTFAAFTAPLQRHPLPTYAHYNSINSNWILYTRFFG